MSGKEKGGNSADSEQALLEVLDGAIQSARNYGPLCSELWKALALPDIDFKELSNSERRETILECVRGVRDNLVELADALGIPGGDSDDSLDGLSESVLEGSEKQYVDRERISWVITAVLAAFNTSFSQLAIEEQQEINRSLLRHGFTLEDLNKIYESA